MSWPPSYFSFSRLGVAAETSVPNAPMVTQQTDSLERFIDSMEIIQLCDVRQPRCTPSCCFSRNWSWLGRGLNMLLRGRRSSQDNHNGADVWRSRRVKPDGCRRLFTTIRGVIYGVTHVSCYHCCAFGFVYAWSGLRGKSKTANFL